jgi:hypothetical protein
LQVGQDGRVLLAGLLCRRIILEERSEPGSQVGEICESRIPNPFDLGNPALPLRCCPGRRGQREHHKQEGDRHPRVQTSAYLPLE